MRLDDSVELENLTELLYQLPVGVIRCALPGGDVQLMNPLVARLASSLLASWSSRSVFDLLEPCFPDLRTLVEKSDIDSGLLFENKRLYIDALEPDATAAWLSVTGLRLDAEMVLVVNDITQEVMRENEIRQARAWITALMQSTNSHMACLLDEAGFISRWMPYAEQLTGLTAQAVTGRHFSTLFCEDHGGLQNHAAARLARATSSGWDLQDEWMRRALLCQQHRHAAGFAQPRGLFCPGGARHDAAARRTGIAAALNRERPSHGHQQPGFFLLRRP